MAKFKTVRTKKKIQKPFYLQKWRKQETFYHNNTSQHFFLGVAKRGDTLAGHDMTTHPTLYKNGKPKRRYLKLKKNPNPKDNRASYLHRKLRKNVRMHFEDTHQLRLIRKKKWKLCKEDSKIIKKMDRKQIKNPHNSI